MNDKEKEIIKKALLEKMNFVFIDEFENDNWKNTLDWYAGTEYIVIIKTDYKDGTIIYDFDKATAYGNYIDDFWDTENDYIEGDTEVHVVAYCPLGLGEWLARIDN